MPRGSDSSGRRIRAPRGTIRPHPGFDEETALAQVRTLYRALQRPVDTAAVISVLTKYTLHERKYVEDVYNVQHEPKLQHALRAAFSYNAQATLLALLQWHNQFLAVAARRALVARPTDKATLIELFCGQSQDELRDLVRTYDRLHSRPLQAELRAQLNGELRQLALALIALNRDQSELPGDNAARELAGRLAAAGQGRDAEMFISAFSTASYPLLRRAFELLPEVNPSHADIQTVIRASFGGDIRTGLLAVAQCVADQPGYFAERLYRAMRGLGTDDTALIRILVSRAENDLQNIKDAYHQRYGKSLAAAVEDDTSGTYWHCLRAIIKP
ncbi:Annexin A13 [Amphibalanus amphitrite]|uniref:Annexin n=1 Tax=Amphibalanus amphitrite TaxID=1232801 RepID=A0A6A4W757_AMPAM|nr:Annexin A13 [Amphibalanus amphitrite]